MQFLGARSISHGTTSLRLLSNDKHRLEKKREVEELEALSMEKDRCVSYLLSKDEAKSEFCPNKE